MDDWREDGQAAHEMELLYQQWLEDQQAQQEYINYLMEAENEVD